jgi:transcriptional regulator with XRE-family HTH domain
MDDYRATVVAYLNRASDLSLNEIAKRVGVSHTTLTRPVNNPDYKYVPKYETLKKIAAVTSVPLPMELTELNPSTPTIAALQRLTVRGVVAAGMWQAVELVQDEPLGEASMMEDASYRGVPQWAELVRGPSMNRTYQDGDYLHVVDWPSIGQMPTIGEDVIVERRRHQDGTVERTCKRIALVEGQLALVGDSTVAHWNDPLPMDGGPDTIIQIVGLVIGSYRPRRRR